MGPAHSTVKNHTENRLCVITFTYTDLLYFTYNTLYTIEPGATRLVESQPDATGLKIGVVFEVSKDKKEFMYQRFVCPMDSVLNISEISYESGEISWFGSDNITGYTTGKIKESNMIAISMAYEAIHNLPITVGQENGKFEKELIKRIAMEYLDSKKNNIKSNNYKEEYSSSLEVDSSKILTQAASTVTDTRSAAEKWELEFQKMKRTAAEQERQLSESKIILNERLVRVVQEEAYAAEIEADRIEKLRQDELRQKQLIKDLAEEENEEINKKLKNRRKKKCTLS